MKNILELLGNNYEWFFSGLGVFILSMIYYFFTKDNRINQQIKSGNNSTNIQIGNINKK